MRRLIATAASCIAVAALLFGSVICAWRMLEAGWGEGPALVLVSLAAAAVLLFAQKVIAYRDDWRSWHETLRVDLLHTVVSTAGMGTLFDIVVIAALLHLSVALTTWLDASLWPSAWPLVPQFALALVVGELGVYSLHRLLHHSRFGWRFHALHHSSKRLTLMAALRNHPINALLTGLAHTGALVVLGAGPEILLLVATFTSVNGLFQHSNIDLPIAPLDRVFATPAVHRVHHETELERQMTNFGSNLMIWDQIFGTYVPPSEQGLRADVGIPEFAIPNAFAAHMLTPFRLYRWLHKPVDEVSWRAEDAPT